MAATENKDYPENISFISTTQPSSHITYANEAFCDVAEYELDEMLAQPHNMVRHPEMPKAAFEQLWQYLNQGKKLDGDCEEPLQRSQALLGVGVCHTDKGCAG